jgi:predicted ATPase
VDGEEEGEVNLKNMSMELLDKEFTRLRAIDGELAQRRQQLKREQDANDELILDWQREVRRRMAAIEKSAAKAEVNRG